MSKSLKITHVIANNAHIVELTNIVKTMISKQKQQMIDLMKTNTYTAIFKFRAVTAAAESLSVCEISTHLAKEIIIRCFNVISENCV